MRKLKITSLILVVVMLAGMIPMGIFSASAADVAPSGFPTLPNGQVYGKDYYTANYFTKDFVLPNSNTYTSTKTQGWRGAEGLLLAYKNDVAKNAGDETGENGHIHFLISGNVGQNGMKYAFASTEPYKTNLNTYKAKLTYIYTMRDGANWVARGLGGNGGTTSMMFHGTGGEIGWMWIPMETFRWSGNGADGYAEESYDFIGRPMAEVLEYFEQQNIELVFNVWSDSNTTVVQADWVYFVEDHKKPAATEDVGVVPNGSVILEDNKVSNQTTSGLTVDKTAWKNEGRLTATNMWVGNLYDAARLTADVPNTSLTDAVGFEFDVDSSKLGANATLNLRTRLQVKEVVAKMPYATMNLIYNDQNTTPTIAWPNVYEVFNDKNDGTGVNGGYVQLTTRSSDSVAYLTGTDAAGTTYTNTMVHVNAPQTTVGDAGVGSNIEDTFSLPAGFVGKVYIPMNSFWINIYGSYASKCLVRFDPKLAPEFDAIVLGSTVSGTPVANEVTYSNFKVVNADPEVIEIGSVDDYMTKFVGVMKQSNKNDFAGKIVRLTADLDFTGTTYTFDNNVRFAGTFDGNGHVIRNLTVTGTSHVGILGNTSVNAKTVVKDVTFLKCSVSSNGTNVGGIFGIVYYDYGQTKPAHDIESYYSSAKVTFSNVYANINVHSALTTGADAKVGGFVGELKGDAEVIDCVYTGTVSTSSRGVGGLFGYVLQNRAGYNSVTNMFLKLRIDIKNVVVIATLKATGYQGGIAGNSFSQIVHYDIQDSYIIPTFQNVSGGNPVTPGSIIGATDMGGSADRTKALKASTGNFATDHPTVALSDVYTVTTGVEKRGKGNEYIYFHANNGMTADAPTKNTGGQNTNVGLSALPEVLMVRNGAMKQSVSVAEDFALNVFVNKYDVVARSDMVNTLETTKITMTINGQNATLVPTDDGYMATFEDILPQEISDNIEITYKVGSTNVTKNTTVESYLRGLLTSDDENLVAFVADTLRYVRATQDFFGDKIANKVNTSNLPAGAGMDKVAIVEKYLEYPLEADNEAFTGVALMLDGQLAVLIGVVNPALTYTADLDNGTALDVVVGEGDYIKIYITPNALRQTLTVTAETGNEVGFYISDYIGLVLSMDISEAQANVLVALCNYMASATVYAPPAVAD